MAVIKHKIGNSTTLPEKELGSLIINEADESINVDSPVTGNRINLVSKDKFVNATTEDFEYSSYISVQPQTLEEDEKISFRIRPLNIFDPRPWVVNSWFSVDGAEMTSLKAIGTTDYIPLNAKRNTQYRITAGLVVPAESGKQVGVRVKYTDNSITTIRCNQDDYSLKGTTAEGKTVQSLAFYGNETVAGTVFGGFSISAVDDPSEYSHFWDSDTQVLDAKIGVPISSSGTTTANGLTITKTDTGIVSLSGTATANGYINFGYYTNYGVRVPNMTSSYFISGCPTGGSATTYYIGLEGWYSDPAEYRDYGEGFVYDWKNHGSGPNNQIPICIYYKSGTVFDNVVFKPGYQEIKKPGITFYKGENLIPESFYFAKGDMSSTPPYLTTSPSISTVSNPASNGAGVIFRPPVNGYYTVSLSSFTKNQNDKLYFFYRFAESLDVFNDLQQDVKVSAANVNSFTFNGERGDYIQVGAFCLSEDGAPSSWTLSSFRIEQGSTASTETISYKQTYVPMNSDGSIDYNYQNGDWPVSVLDADAMIDFSKTGSTTKVDGTLAIKRITSLEDPFEEQDAVNLRTLEKGLSEIKTWSPQGFVEEATGNNTILKSKNPYLTLQTENSKTQISLLGSDAAPTGEIKLTANQGSIVQSIDASQSGYLTKLSTAGFSIYSNSSLRIADFTTSGLNMNSFKISSLGSPSASDDAATKAYVDKLASAYQSDSFQNTEDNLIWDYSQIRTGNLRMVRMTIANMLSFQGGKGASADMKITFPDTFLSGYSYAECWSCNFGDNHTRLTLADEYQTVFWVTTYIKYEGSNTFTIQFTIKDPSTGEMYIPSSDCTSEYKRIEAIVILAK